MGLTQPSLEVEGPMFLKYDPLATTASLFCYRFEAKSKSIMRQEFSMDLHIYILYFNPAC